MKKSKGDVVTVNGEDKQFESEFEADAAMNTDNIKAGDTIWNIDHLLVMGCNTLVSLVDIRLSNIEQTTNPLIARPLSEKS